jgi:hypothetical protein
MKELDEQVKRGVELLGKRVRFPHMKSLPYQYFRVQAVHSDGMVDLEGFKGQFAPHLFIAEDEERQKQA